MPPHYQGKGANQRRPQHEGVACGFGPSFHNPVVDRSQFVHVVALVGTATGIAE